MSHNSGFFINVLCIAVVVVGVGICSYRKGMADQPAPRIQIDTLWFEKPVHDTVVETRYITRLLPVVHDTTYVRDTTIVRDSVMVEIPIETKVFHKEDVYYAEISGYETSLDYLEVYPKIEYRTETIYKRSAVNFGFAIGYGGSSGGLTPFIGLGITYNPFVRK